MTISTYLHLQFFPPPDWWHKHFNAGCGVWYSLLHTSCLQRTATCWETKNTPVAERRWEELRMKREEKECLRMLFGADLNVWCLMSRIRAADNSKVYFLCTSMLTNLVFTPPLKIMGSNFVIFEEPLKIANVENLCIWLFLNQQPQTGNRITRYGLSPYTKLLIYLF